MTGVTGDTDDDAPVTFGVFAQRIGRSRPYVSKLKAEGKLTARCFAPDGRIIPRLALEDIAAAADPARGARGIPADSSSEGTYARQRARKTAAEAERAEVELKARKGELVERQIIASTLAPWVRELRDAILAVPRDTVPDPVHAADAEAALSRTLESFTGRVMVLAETPNDGGAGAG